jgi:hypothetical protein
MGYRLAYVEVSPLLFTQWFSRGIVGMRVVADALPVDATLLNVKVREGRVMMFFASQAFPEVKGGQSIPRIQPTFASGEPPRGDMGSITGV